MLMVVLTVVDIASVQEDVLLRAVVTTELAVEPAVLL
jgi:hypothetical protein